MRTSVFKYLISDFDYKYFFSLQSMLIYDPAVRITAKEAMHHPYFSDLDKTALPAQ